jgi:hypothetical protein
MLGFLKMSALSAVLSFVSVTAYNQSVAAGPSKSAGTKGDRLVAGVPTNCADQEWPYIAADCLTRDDGRAKPGHVRVITIERREGANTSVLQRVPQTTIAQR